MSQPMETAFAPAERATAEVVEKQSQSICAQPLAMHVVEGMPHAVMVLNKYRQIVMVNAAFLGLIQKPLLQILGKRPGEALGCINAGKTPGGCGTTEACRDCGAVLAILAAQEGQAGNGECCLRLDAQGHGADLELAVSTSPMEVEEESYVLACATDISATKRRRSLERIFFHDVLNSISNLTGFAHLLNTPNNDNQARHAQLIEQTANKLIEEIAIQKDLIAAENGELKTIPFTCRSMQIIAQAVDTCRAQETIRKRNIVVDQTSEQLELYTDPMLLSRVLINMLKNALEASDESKTITIGSKQIGDKLRFWVHNPEFIPKANHEFIFHRSFSTKSSDRGLGTYGMYLISTRYLKGSIGFESSPDKGTTFYVDLPKMLQ